jgi:amidase
MEDRRKRLDRRELVGLLGLAAAAGAAAPLLGRSAPQGGSASAGEDSFPFAEYTVEQLQELLNLGELTSEALTAAYLERIARVDPLLRSVVETNPEALAIARALDQERRKLGPRGPLHGIPVLLKDNIATADTMETTAGSLARWVTNHPGTPTW